MTLYYYPMVSSPAAKISAPLPSGGEGSGVRGSKSSAGLPPHPSPLPQGGEGAVIRLVAANGRARSLWLVLVNQDYRLTANRLAAPDMANLLTSLRFDI